MRKLMSGEDLKNFKTGLIVLAISCTWLIVFLKVMEYMGY